MKRILLISYNFYPELTGIGKYNGEMVEWLVRYGYDCTVLTAYPYYPHWKVQESYRSKRYWYFSETPHIPEAKGRLTVHRCPLYVPARPSGFNRMLLEITFFISAFVRMLGLCAGRRYDFVMTVAPAFHVGLLGLFYKFLRGTKLIYHIQDLQIEAARDLKMITSTRLIHMMFFLEKQILLHADVTSTISDGMLNKVRQKGPHTTALFPNWTNTSHLYPIEDRRSIKRQFGFNETDKIILYSGAIGEKQGLEAILHSARCHRHHDEESLRFVICGNGPYRHKLEETARKLDLKNVLFLPLQPPGRFNHFLNAADIHLVIQKAGTSDLVMPSKLGGILAVGGLVLITANRGTSLHDLIRKHEMGYLIDTDDQDALNEAVDKMLHGDFEYMRRNARNYALTFLSHERVMLRFEQELSSTLSKGLRAVKFRSDTQVENLAIDSAVRGFVETIDHPAGSSLTHLNK